MFVPFPSFQVLDSLLPALLRMVHDYQAAVGKDLDFKEGTHVSPHCLCLHTPYSCHFHPPKLERIVLGVRKIVFEMWFPQLLHLTEPRFPHL